ncbi:MAG TPA: type III polyketide synthase [Beijerinckiaceae bacterium]|jgi:alkylresorcinol/alkylpyrone synthase
MRYLPVDAITAKAKPLPEQAEVRLLGLTPVTAPFTLDQNDVMRRARLMFGPRMTDFERLARVFENTGILTRQSVKPADWYHQPCGWPERTQAYLETGTALFEQAARAALDAAGLKPQDVDTIVTVSSTGIATPSLEAQAFAALGFRPETKRVPVFGLGCAGGVSGLSLAARLARAEPGTVVLFVAIELCTLAIRADRAAKADLVATALFGDGAVGAVLAAGGVGDASAPIIGAGHEHTWPGTLDIMGWSVDPVGFGVIFDRAIPPFVHAEYRTAVESLFKVTGLAWDDIDRFVCHPGGTKVVAALEEALQLEAGVLTAEREVLRDHGNMSAPTALFVLRKVLDSGFKGRAVLSALGPGFTASFVTLRVPGEA